MSYRKPTFYNPGNVGTTHVPDLQRAAMEGLNSGLQQARLDRTKRLLVIIDPQVDFVDPDGALSVKGAVADIRRICTMVIEQADTISGIMISLDQHLPLHIWSQAWWRDAQGKLPELFTQIRPDDVASERLIPQYIPHWSHKYVESLEKTGQNPLTIWPAHCRVGTKGASIDPALAEVLEWLCVARSINPRYIYKGSIPETEHYGPFMPCVRVQRHPQGDLNVSALREMDSSYQIIDVCGEAEDYCVREGMRQIMRWCSTGYHRQQFRFLTDCTSMVFPDHRNEADAFLQEMRDAGIKTLKSTEL